MYLPKKQKRIAVANANPDPPPLWHWQDDSVKCIFSLEIGIDVKKTDLEKLQGTKIASNMKLSSIPDRFGKDAANMPDKREQRKRDQEAGLIPFAVKLHSDIIKQIHALADTQKKSLNDVTAELLSKALALKK